MHFFEIKKEFLLVDVLFIFSGNVLGFIFIFREVIFKIHKFAKMKKYGELKWELLEDAITCFNF